MSKQIVCLGLALGLAACGRGDHIGKPPSFTPNTESPEQAAMLLPGLPETVEPRRKADQASLWAAGAPIPVGGPARDATRRHLDGGDRN